MLAVILVFIGSQGLVFELYGKVAWTGVKYATLVQLANVLLYGASISQALTIVGLMAAGGPLFAFLTTLGRGLIVKLIRRWGVKKFAKW